MTKGEAPDKIKWLVERCDEQKEFYKKAAYNETQIRQNFIAPFWKAPGWDMDNENSYAESYWGCSIEFRYLLGCFFLCPHQEASSV